MDDRKEIEKEFHNEIRKVSEDLGVSETRWSPNLEYTIQTNSLWRNMKYYSIERKSREFINDWWHLNCPGRSVLDYCCGNGDDSIRIVDLGAKEVIGIDISDISIENCNNHAKEQDIDDKVKFLVMDAEDLGFDDNRFDVINEYGCLHHLDLALAIPELARVLKPGGRFIGDETLGHNWAIRWYRNRTPDLRTQFEKEHILKKDNFEYMSNFFNRIDLHFFHYFTLFAVPFRKLTSFSLILSFLEAIDEVVLKLPAIKWHAWQVVFILSDPKK